MPAVSFQTFLQYDCAYLGILFKNIQIGRLEARPELLEQFFLHHCIVNGYTTTKNVVRFSLYEQQKSYRFFFYNLLL